MYIQKQFYCWKFGEMIVSSHFKNFYFRFWVLQFFKIFLPQFEFGPIRSPNELSQLQILQDGVAPKYLIGSKFKSWWEKTKNSESEVEALEMT